ncbi:MAG TPA: hypothetical protein VJN88_05710 [Ktedonobacterales bacterium]|nr:hypothetical protein [Ktedonobacterales bacterium]
MTYAPPRPTYWPQPPLAPAPRHEDGPAVKPPRGPWSDRFGLFFGLGVTLVTLAAIALAAFAPAFASRPSATPISWSSVYSGNPKDDPNWQHAPGPCAIQSAGLRADGIGVGNAPDILSSLCVYSPTQGRDLLSQGFALDLTVAPAAKLPNEERVAVFIGDVNAGDGVLAEMGQGGGLGAIYLLCDGSDNCSSPPTVAWHTDGFVKNTLSLRYLPGPDGRGTLTLYGNGQRVAWLNLMLPANPVIAIGAGSDASALYTGFSLSSASA